MIPTDPTSPMFFVKLFAWGALFLFFTTVVCTAIVFVCNAAVMAQALKKEKEKVSDKDRAIMKRELKREQKHEQNEREDIAREHYNKSIKKIEKAHAAEVAALEKKLEKEV